MWIPSRRLFAALLIFCGYFPRTLLASIECDKILNTPSGVACYKAVDGALEWSAAQRECERIGGNLVTVTSEAENNVVRDMLQEHTHQDVWLGIRETMSKWSWLDGREVRGQGCFLDNETNSDFSMSPEIIADNSPDKCIRNCAAVGARYAALFNRDFCLCGNDFGKYGQNGAECNKACPGTPPNPFISCGGPSSNAIYAVHGEYSNWQPGQPNNHFDYQRCAIMDGENDYQWNDVSCHESHGSVCKLKMSSPVCAGENFLQVGGSCFYITTLSTRFFDARADCYSRGGELAQFVNGEEESEVMEYIREQNFTVSGFWIGLVRWKWEWTTGEEVYYSNWNSGQPNGVEQHCVSLEVVHGMWSDEDCTSIHRIICEIDNSTIIKSTTKSQVTKFATTTVPPTTTLPPTTAVPTSPRPNPFDKIKDFYENNKIIVYIIIAAVVCIVVGIIICVVVCRKKRKSPSDRSPQGHTEQDIAADHFFGLSQGESGATKGDRPEVDDINRYPPDVIPKDR